MCHVVHYRKCMLPLRVKPLFQAKEVLVSSLTEFLEKFGCFGVEVPNSCQIGGKLKLGVEIKLVFGAYDIRQRLDVSSLVLEIHVVGRELKLVIW